MQKRTKVILIAAACAMLLAAAALSFKIEQTGERSKIIGRLKEFGYNLSFSDLYLAGSSANGTIRAMLPEGLDLSDAVNASLSSGFPSDVEKTGEIALLLAKIGGGDVITVFVVNGEIELCFIQTEGTNQVKPL
jgi:hypothetical protein